jgi:hypothetical protein
VIGPATIRASLIRGYEMEEPIEPPSLEECRLRVVGGAKVLDFTLASLKEAFYEYNRSIRGTGYYLKPVHKVYKYVGGSRRVYEYYGRYWWRFSRTGRKFRYIYAGVVKPESVQANPPGNPLEGLSLIREGSDVIVKCSDFEKFSSVFRGYRVVREV